MYDDKLLKSATRRRAFDYLCTAWLSGKLEDFRVAVLQVAQPPEAAKGLKARGGATRNNGRNNGNYNATSGAAISLLKEYRPFRVSSHCLSDSAKPRWAVTVLVLAARAFRGSNFADALAAGTFLAFLLRGSQLPSNARSASERESTAEARPRS